jgi:hypothetical protein
MVDSDDVLLLRPTDPPHRPGPCETDAGAHPGAVVAIGVVTYRPEYRLERHLSTLGHAALEAAFGVPVATWRTNPAANSFPELPVRREHAFVWQASFADGELLAGALHRLDDSAPWRCARLALGEHRETRLRLAPTPRSRHPRPDREDL